MRLPNFIVSPPPCDCLSFTETGAWIETEAAMGVGSACGDRDGDGDGDGDGGGNGGEKVYWNRKNFRSL